MTALLEHIDLLNFLLILSNISKSAACENKLIAVKVNLTIELSCTFQ